MIRRFLTVLSLLFGVLATAGLCRTARASEVHYLPLERVLTPATVVFKATVTAAKKTTVDSEKRVGTAYDFTLAEIEAMQGKPPTAPYAVYYDELIPVMRDAAGKVNGWGSPIRTASGCEHEIAKGQRYIFFIASADSPFLIRAERLTGEANVRAAMRGDAGAAPLPAATASASATAPPTPATAAPATTTTTTSTSAPPPAVAKPSRGCNLHTSNRAGPGASFAVALVAMVFRLRLRPADRRR